MAQAPTKVHALVAPVVESLGYELVGVEYIMQGRNSLLRVYIDAEAGITLDDCSKVSHQLSGVLDVEDVIRSQYQLEISSPGLDRPLFTLEHFARFTGHKVRMRLRTPLQGRRKVRGVIDSVGDDSVTLTQVDDEPLAEALQIPFAAIDKANLVPDL